MAKKAVKKILICDDDLGILEVTKIILESNGYEVAALDSGKAIVSRVKQFLPHLILLDLWMPGIEGKEISKLLKSDPVTSKIPIIMVSAVNDLEKVATDLPADDFLSKPYDMDDLLKMAEKHIGSKS
jgi:CheY-like chemotaxis protein